MLPITETVQDLILITGSGFLGFGFVLLFAPAFTRLLQKFQIKKTIREVASDGKAASRFHALHQKKSGTPTMGGILIWGGTLFVVVLSRFLSYVGVFEHSLWNRKETYLALFTLVTVALLGALDDVFNIYGWGRSKGLNIRPKMFWLVVLAVLSAWWFYYKLDYTSLHLPGIGDFNLGLWMIPLFIFIFIGSANAVNITDGLDGLAGGLAVIAYLSYSALAYAHGLLILSALCAVIAGSTLGFLWFNIAPARFYMGDTGALSLGATLGVIAMLTNTVAVLPFIAFIFVVETLSVIAQLVSKRLFGKKIFRIAPVHHHFEDCGWPETQVVMRFWILGGLFATVGVLLGLIGMGNGLINL